MGICLLPLPLEKNFHARFTDPRAAIVSLAIIPMSDLESMQQRRRLRTVGYPTTMEPTFFLREIKVHSQKKRPESKVASFYYENEKMRNNKSHFLTMKELEIGKTKGTSYVKTFSFVY